MTTILAFYQPFILSEATLSLLKPKFTNFSLIKPQVCSTSSTLSLLNRRSLFFNQTHFKSIVLCARNNKRRSGYGKINKFVHESVYLFVTSSKVLPEPLALMVKEFGGGNGRGVRFFKGFGGGGKKNNKNSLFFIFLIVFGFVIWLSMGKRLEGDLFLVTMMLMFFGVLICERGFKDWALCVCIIAAVEFLGFKGDNLQRLMKRSGPLINLRRRKGKRAL